MLKRIGLLTDYYPTLNIQFSSKVSLRQFSRKNDDQTRKMEKTIMKADKFKEMYPIFALFTLWQCHNSMFPAVWPECAEMDVLLESCSFSKEL